MCIRDSAYVMKTEHKLDLPRRLQIEFSGAVQKHTDTEGGEMTPAQIWDAFQHEYLEQPGPVVLHDFTSSHVEGDAADVRLEASVTVAGEDHQISGRGNGPISAFVDGLNGLGIDIRVLDYAEHALSAGEDALAAAYVE